MSDNMTAIERLEELLNEKDHKLAELEAKQAELDYEKAWAWMKQEVSEESEGLPVPRLEIRWEPEESGWGWLAKYSLVYRFFLGEFVRMPISVTRQSGGGHDKAPIYDGTVQMPFRDGTHIRHDMRHLNLPGFAICQGVVTALEPMDRAAPYETSKKEG